MSAKDVLFNFINARKKATPRSNSLGITHHSQIWDKFDQGLTAADIQAGTKASAEWYKQKIKELGKINTNQLMAVNDRLRQTGIVGQMFIFYYDAKNKNDAKKLPYWDRVPCVFILKKDKDSFLSLNLHYLRPRDRMALLYRLYQLASGSVDDPKTKLRISYNILKNVSKFKLAKRCIKRHLFAHIKSRLLYVPASQYDLAALLPIAKWERKTADYVYADGARRFSNW